VRQEACLLSLSKSSRGSGGVVVGLPCREAAMGGTQYTCRAAASASCNCHASISCSTPPLPEFLLIISDGRRRSLVNHLGTPLLLSRNTQTQRAHVGLAFQREFRIRWTKEGRLRMVGRWISPFFSACTRYVQYIPEPRLPAGLIRLSQGLPSVSIPAAKLTSPAS